MNQKSPSQKNRQLLIILIFLIFFLLIINIYFTFNSQKDGPENTASSPEPQATSQKILTTTTSEIAAVDEDHLEEIKKNSLANFVAAQNQAFDSAPVKDWQELLLSLQESGSLENPQNYDWQNLQSASLVSFSIDQIDQMEEDSVYVDLTSQAKLTNQNSLPASLITTWSYELECSNTAENCDIIDVINVSAVLE